MRAIPDGPSSASSSRSAPSDADIRAALDRLLASPLLQKSERRRDFLRYVVEETLAGRAGRIKGYTIGTEVFGRDESFDANTDPIVRLEAINLRHVLDSYSLDEGQAEPVRISVPKGGYVPRFDWYHLPDPPPMEAPAQDMDEASGARAVTDLWAAPGTVDPGQDGSGGIQRSRVLIPAMMGLIAVLAGICVAGWLYWPRAEQAIAATTPALVVLPFEPLSKGDDDRYLAAGLHQEMIATLQRFPGFRLYSTPVGAGLSQRPPVAVADDLGVAYVLSGSVRIEDDVIQIAAQLFDAGSGRVIWSRPYDRAPEPAALIELQQDMAQIIATELGQPYGVVNSGPSALRGRRGTRQPGRVFLRAAGPGLPAVLCRGRVRPLAGLPARGRDARSAVCRSLGHAGLDRRDGQQFRLHGCAVFRGVRPGPAICHPSLPAGAGQSAGPDRDVGGPSRPG